MTERRPARLFAALELPRDIVTGLAEWAAAEVGDRSELRLLAPESLHVTLCFLGWRDEAEMGDIGEAVATRAAPVPSLTFHVPIWLPPRRPRVLAVDLVDGAGALAALQRSVSDALVEAAGYEPEQRDYRPHVTVARVRGSARVRAQELAPPPAREFTGAALTLFRSRLARAGASYEPLVRSEL
ncbi:MAG: 2,3-cyclic 3-phosphodiesterase [Solirubrobacteraceae bacterium]|nr:2,3-cyclic 3-phosphodiesterase [Solirubrobacteraceae bacterium]